MYSKTSKKREVLEFPSNQHGIRADGGDSCEGGGPQVGGGHKQTLRVIGGARVDARQDDGACGGGAGGHGGARGGARGAAGDKARGGGWYLSLERDGRVLLAALMLSLRDAEKESTVPGPASGWRRRRR